MNTRALAQGRRERGCAAGGAGAHQRRVLGGDEDGVDVVEAEDGLHAEVRVREVGGAVGRHDQRVAGRADVEVLQDAQRRRIDSLHACAPASGDADA